MELIEAAPGRSITIRFSAEEFVHLLRVVSTASQEYESLDKELLDHVSDTEVAALMNGLSGIFEKRT